ncbi:MAG: hypothetical protein J6V99_05440 [Neisseriaceae bacterium]|nr:hypothetical protein [Neisseriaceae bacterium]
MQLFGTRLTEYLQVLEKSDSVLQIAEILENAITQIKDFDVGRDLKLQTIKYKALQDFSYQAAQIVRSKKSNFTIPDNKRRINVEICKVFINEVYLKQQLLGYSFRNLSNRQLGEFSYPIIKDFLRKEQRIRKLHIVQTSRFLFAIAPSLEQSQNPYRVRRFLEESKLFSADSWIFNGSFIEFRRLETEKRPEIVRSMEDQLRHHIDHIVSVESGISPILIEFFEKLEDYYYEQLMPALFMPISVDEELNTAITNHLKVHEDELNKHVLNPLKQTLSRLLHTDDECNYAFIATQQLFALIINVFSSFQSLPLIIGNKVAQRFYERLIAYSVFLSKRRSDIFVKQMEQTSVWEHEKTEQMKEGFKQCCDLIRDVFPQYYDLQQEVATLKRKIEAPETFFSKLLKRKDTLEQKLYETERQASRISYSTHQELCALSDKNQQSIVDLDFDAQVMDIEQKRRFAFPDGENGLTKLPKLLVFSGFVGDFDLPQIAEQIIPDTVLKVQKERS